MVEEKIEHTIINRMPCSLADTEANGTAEWSGFANLLRVCIKTSSIDT